MSIDPPKLDRPPKWAQTLVNAARTRNRERESPEVFSMADLIATWDTCGGRCAFSGLPFDMQLIGTGQAKCPFAPSLDRIDSHKPYQRDNVRLAVVIANFARNAWGDKPVLQLATALHLRHGGHLPSVGSAPSDSSLDGTAVIETELVQTNVGKLAFPPRPDLYGPIIKLLKRGPTSSRDIEDALAKRFGITAEMRASLLGNGHPAWRKLVAWALGDLGKRNRGTSQIERVARKKAPAGGSMGIYRLVLSHLVNRP